MSADEYYAEAATELAAIRDLQDAGDAVEGWPHHSVWNVHLKIPLLGWDLGLSPWRRKES